VGIEPVDIDVFYNNNNSARTEPDYDLTVEKLGGVVDKIQKGKK
tara:strand:+ start:700 stop:831 length:132 start_codon:yes stop_codon:yes gene_type:complete